MFDPLHPTVMGWTAKGKIWDALKTNAAITDTLTGGDLP